MIDPMTATYVIIGFLVVFGVLLPVINIRFEKYISLRWYVIVVVLALLVGVVIDFAALDEESRHIMMIGGLIIGGGFVLMRTLEKALYNGWIGHGHIKLTAEKGAMKGTVEYTPNAANDEKRE